MLEQILPVDILKNLKCSLCGGYLCFIPLAIDNNEKVVCGKCYKTLIKEEQGFYIRQRALESVLGQYTFPCRYQKDGCKHVFKFNDDDGHEESCSFKYNLINNLDTTINGAKLTNPKEYSCDSNEIETKLKYNLRDSNTLAYALSIKGKNGNTIVILDKDKKLKKENLCITLRGLASTGTDPSILKSEIDIHQMENLYETLKPSKCHTCNTIVASEDIHYCLYGHSACNRCKGNMCILCIKQLNGKLTKFCPLCEQVEPFDGVNTHECECRNMKCPISECPAKIKLNNLQQHVVNMHLNVYVESAEVSKEFFFKDSEWFMNYNGDIFKCNYYFYNFFVDIFITFTGNSKLAGFYKYEVCVMHGDKVVKQKLRTCANWNNSTLHEGITFNAEEVFKDNKKSFTANVKILK
ncbi:unnamed protein product [Brassicogethes aeneus]|uniref:E3 ubiquitin-protein ligase n=1 Tax=Brassicogethes aeneus TaxID=1431903 RepID=A0A9P0FJH7_BRAAE|nr:unnamed protein product [Brassicogethes aeneus]